MPSQYILFIVTRKNIVKWPFLDLYRKPIFSSVCTRFDSLLPMVYKFGSDIYSGVPMFYSLLRFDKIS